MSVGFAGSERIEQLRARLHSMTDGELVAFGKQMRALVYPLTYGPDGQPSVSAFSLQLEEARAEWRRRKTQSR